jgi:L-threonylcarbamoyladenylate synthase
MPARIVPINPDDPRPDRLEEAVAVLRAGEVIALPTETFYGLATDPFRPRSLRGLNRLKGKDEGSPVLLLLADVAQAEQAGRDLPPLFHELASLFWPGPLTLVVRAAPGLPPEVSGGRGTVGVRVPGLALPRRLAGELGSPITGVSANATGSAPLRRAQEVVRAFPRGVAMVLDGGASPGGAPSTVLDLCVEPPRMLRAGAVPLSALRAFLPAVSL